MKSLLRRVIKIALVSLPKAPFSPDGVCPKCGSPLEARISVIDVVFLCKNWKCDYFVRIDRRK